jgi:hypothetical protein
MSDSLLRLLVLLRFLCFVAVVYLTLHVIFSRLISRRESKILWFFSVLTSPLTWPVRTWVVPNASESRLRFLAIVAYGAIWAAVLIVTRMAALASR